MKILNGIPTQKMNHSLPLTSYCCSELEGSCGWAACLGAESEQAPGCCTSPTSPTWQWQHVQLRLSVTSVITMTPLVSSLSNTHTLLHASIFPISPSHIH